MSRISHAPFDWSKEAPSANQESNPPHKQEQAQARLQTLVQKYKWKRLSSNYYGVSSYFYDQRSDTIIEHENVSGAIAEHHRGAEVFRNLTSLNADVIPDTHPNHFKIWDF